MRRADRTRVVFVSILGLAVLLVLVVRSCTTPPPGGVAGSLAPAETTTGAGSEATGPAAASSDVVQILFWTNDTKADWVKAVTQRFNEQQHRIGSGQIVQVEVQKGDSPDALREIQASTLQPAAFSPGEMSWVNQANTAWSEQSGRPFVRGDCPPLVYTAIGFGMWQPMAEALGWPNPISWRDIVELAADPQGWATYGHSEWGQFKFGHTNPDSSNTGLLALTSLAYAAAGVEGGLTPQLVYGDEVREAFRELELQTYHYGTSTRALCEAMAAHGPGYLHAITTSEINVQACNYFQREVEPNLQFPLVFIAPEEGIFWSDNPFCVLDAAWVTAEQQEAAAVYRDYLLSREAQEIAIDQWLRPAVGNIPLRAPMDRAHGIDPEMTLETARSLPSVSGETTNAIIDLFRQTKRPATIVVLLDTSQSMEGSKLTRALAGTQTFMDFLERDDELIIYRFGSDVAPLAPSGRVADIKETLGRTIGGLFAEGNTVLYDAVCEGMETLLALQAEDEAAGEPRLYGMVLLSDGEDTSSERTEGEMLYSCLPVSEAVTGIKVFTIAYGDDANEDLLARIANRTNANFYAANPETIAAIYEWIAYEQ
jgi:Ca-activated chloride channel homolog